MNGTLATSNINHRRILRACEWLSSREPAEEVLIVGASRDAANELARRIAKQKGAAFGWHQFSLPQLAAAIAAPALALRRLVPLGQLGTEAIVARIIQRLKTEHALSRYHEVTHTPGFPRALAGVMIELRLARLGPDSVSSVAPDLKLLLDAYEAELAAAALTDWPGMLAFATEAANSLIFGYGTVHLSCLALPS